MQLFSIDIIVYQLIIYFFISYAQKQEHGDSFSCPTNLFRCDMKRCLPYAFVCNGEYNCHDRTDETNCSTTLIDNDLCPRNDSIHCEQDILHSTRLVEHDLHHEYTRPVQICIQRSSVCDGIIDCRNAIDEQCTQQNPLIVCSQDEYQCKITNRCIPKTWLCNGINDCLDPFDSDELDCPTTIKCTSNEFNCRSNQQCVLSTAVCDGIQDCIDGSDESSSICLFPRFCTRDQFACKSTKLCIPKSNICDTINQCHDRSDEMFCSCPLEDYVSRKLFYRCGLTNKCLPKNLDCHIKRQCHPSILEDDDDDDDTECSSLSSAIHRPCAINNSCIGENQYCESYRYQRCVCQEGYRMNETTGFCQDIDECRERVVCDHYCLNTHGSYRCACHENYQLKSDKHTCILRTSIITSAYVYGLFDNGIYRLNMNYDNKLDRIQEWSDADQSNLKPNYNKTFITSTDHAYLLDYDPVDNDLYFAECSRPIRSILMTCPKTRGIFRIHLNQSTARKELIIHGRDYTSIQSLAVDWLHRNIYFVNTRLQTIDVCRLNGSFCRTLLHQTISDYLPQRLLLYPEKGLLFYTAIVKSQVQHVVRLGLDGTNLKLLFTVKITSDIENANYLRSLLTIDRINHHLYFYNGFDRIFILNMHGDILHIQYETTDRFHAFKIYADKMYKAFTDISETNRSEFRINPKYTLGTTLLEPGFTFERNRGVQSSYNQSSATGPSTWLLNSLHNLFYFRYPLHMIDFIISDRNEKKVAESRCDQCEQLCFPNAINQTEIICGCGKYYTLANDGRSCTPSCPEHFFNCQRSKKCIPFYQHCDGITDCTSNEDENNCQACNTTASFHCSSTSKCITRADLCNNITDCLLGEDEQETVCEHFCEWPSVNTCTKKYPNLCSNVEFYCDGKCVSITHRCDETPYCYDGTDEPFDCTNVTCPYEYFKCPSSGKCLPYEKVCDNVEDCPKIDRINGMSADETSQACNFVLTQLTNLTTTITPSQIQMTCESADLFRCKTSNFCINRIYVCDGDLDCSDSSDEDNCENYNHKGILSLLLHKDYTCMNGYRCAQQRHDLDDYNSLCIPLNELCDGINQCPLGDDEHQWRCRNCTNCNSITSVCELINRVPVCQCKKDYMKIANGSCILENNLCNWSYGICSHTNFSQIKDNHTNLCITKQSPVNCQCDRGYDLRKNNDKTTSCVVQSTATFDVMLNPRASFYLYQHDSIFAPVNPSHHLIDAVFVPHNLNMWSLLYTEQRNGRAFIWQQKINQILNSTNRLENNATQIWSSSLFYFTSIEVDWIHRLVYALYDDPSSSSNGIEIMHANTNDYTQLTFVNRLTFSNMKTISSINVQPLQGYLYISAYYDAQHSFVYRSLLDGSNLEIFVTLEYPVLSMTIDYRQPRLYVLLSNGQIESYAIDSSQPWRTTVYQFQNFRPYSIDLYDDALIVMVFNTTDSTYDEMWIDKFGRTVTEKSRKLKTPMIVRYIHEFKYPNTGTSNMVRQVCSEASCPNGRICISTPSYQPLCITPGQMNLCGSSCHSRGICSNGHCVCSNQTYIGDDCEMCRLTDTIHVGCLHIGNDSQPPCMCYLSRSKTRQTPYLCTTLKNDRGETEVPCDRIIAPINREECSRTLFVEPMCADVTHSLIFHVQTQSCVCRETMNRKINCFNHGMLIVNDNENSSTCSCSSPFFGNQCQLTRCSSYCRNNGTCILNETDPVCTCPNGFSGERCQQNICQSIVCENQGKCVIENKQPTCRCPSGFTGDVCHIDRRFPWRSWILTITTCAVLSLIAYTVLRCNFKFIRLKYLFAYRRLHEQIGLEVSTMYAHVPTSDTNSHDRSFEHVLFDENERSALEMTNTQMNTITEEYLDDPFYVDEKQPIFSNDRTLNIGV